MLTPSNFQSVAIFCELTAVYAFNDRVCFQNLTEARIITLLLKMRIAGRFFFCLLMIAHKVVQMMLIC